MATNYTRKQVLAALVSALNPLKSSVGVNSISVYSGELDDVGAAQIIAITPALLVGYLGSKKSVESSSTEFKITRWAVMVVTGDVSGQKTRTEKAIEIIDAIETALDRQNLGLDLITDISVTGDNVLAVTKTQVAHAVEVAIEYGKEF